MKVHLWIPLSKQISEVPMRCRRSTVEKAAFGQKECPRAHGHHASSPCGALGDPGNEIAKRRQRLEHVIAGGWNQDETRSLGRGDRGAWANGHGIAKTEGLLRERHELDFERGRPGPVAGDGSPQRT